jgi:hypothetical protein
LRRNKKTGASAPEGIAYLQSEAELFERLVLFELLVLLEALALAFFLEVVLEYSLEYSFWLEELTLFWLLFSIVFHLTFRG